MALSFAFPLAPSSIMYRLLPSSSALVTAICLLGTMAPISVAQATEVADEISRFRFNGYGTLSYTRDNNNRLAQIRDITQRPKDLSVTGPNWLLDSRLGAQVAYRLTPDIEAVGQAVLRDQVSKEAKDYVELAYLDVQMPSDWRLRLGRVGYDGFLMSDHRNLGYAYPQTRPPVEFYGWLPMYSINGGDVSKEFSVDDARWRLRAQAGQYRTVVPIGTTDFPVQLKPLWALSAQREAGFWRVKAGYTEFDTTNDPVGLAAVHTGLDQIATLNIPALRAVTDEASLLRRKTAFRDAHFRYVTLGAAYDDGTWLAQAEIGKTRTDTGMAPSGTTGYLSIARRFNTLTPFVVLSSSRPGKPLDVPQSDWSALGPSAVGLQQTVYERVLQGTRVDQDTLSLGVRWDFHTRAAVKLQLDHSRIRPWGYAIYFTDFALQAGTTRVNSLTASLDFVF